MDYTRFLDFAEGETNIVLSAPHGGNSKPPDMVARREGKRLQDTHTRKLAYKLVSTLGKPYYIISNIHRKFVDLNRNIEEATEGNPIAEEVWRTWNGVLQYYTDEVSKRYGHGLYIDLHSHNNSDEFQLGYALSRKQYVSIVQGDNKDTSLSGLNDPLNEMLFGEDSLQHQLEFYGYKVHNPLEDETYFGGGFNVRKFSNQHIGSIQVEIPVSLLKADMLGVATALSNSLIRFKERFVDR